MEYVSTESRKGKEYLRSAFHTGIIFVCMGVSALRMLADVFEELHISACSVFWIMAAMMPLLLATEAAKVWSNRFSLFCKYGIPLFYAVVLLAYGIRSREAIAAGMTAILEPILAEVNFYYKTSFTVEVSEAAVIEDTLLFLAAVALVLFLVEAQWLRKRILLAILPVLILLLEMMVGLTPGLTGMILLFAGVLASGMGAWENSDAARSTGRRRAADYAGYLVPLMILVLIPLFGTLFLRQAADYFAQKGALVLEFQGQLEEQLEEQLSSLAASVGRNNWSVITNQNPNNSGEEVMVVTLSEEPTESLYLRGYYGTDYENGSWSDTTATFDTQWDFETYSDITDLAGYQDVPDGTGVITCQLSYTHLSTDIVFVPYTLSGASLGDGCSISGDYRVRKSRLKGRVTYELWDIEMGELVTLNASIRATRGSQVAYADYVTEHYMEVPDTVSSAKAIADVLAQRVGTDTMQALAETGSSAHARNQAKLEIAETVQSYLKRWTYSVDLDSADEGMDVVEYFLSETHTGYCVHYATAAVLILREMGVPARYVSGYRVDLDAFSEEEGQWTASVLDSDGHAWAELYLEGIGWVPLEVAPGYQIESQVLNEEAIMTEPESENVTGTSEDDTDELSESEWEELLSSTARIEITEEDVQQQGEEDTEPSEETGSERQLTEETEPQEDLTGNASQTKEQKKTLRIVAMLLVLLAAAAFAVLMINRMIIRRRRQWMSQLKREISRRRNRRAVQRINNRFYRLLRRRAGVRVRQVSDPEYGRLLARYFANIKEKDWLRYIEIVQKAAFSQEEITDEEAQFCYRIYRSRENNTHEKYK